MRNPIRLERQANHISEQAWALSEAHYYGEASEKHREAAELYAQSAAAWQRLQKPLIGLIVILFAASVGYAVLGILAS